MKKPGAKKYGHPGYNTLDKVMFRTVIYNMRRFERAGIPKLYGGVPERPKGADCKSVVSDFDGSNPSPSTRFCSKALVNQGLSAF